MNTSKTLASIFTILLLSLSATAIEPPCVITLSDEHQAVTFTFIPKYFSATELAKIKDHFGIIRGTERPQRAFQLLRIKHNDDAELVLPEAAVNDLYNPMRVRAGFDFSVGQSTVVFGFSGSDGERAYSAEFVWDQDEKLLTRTIRRIMFGTWESQWKLEGNQWKPVHLNKHTEPRQ